MRPHVHRVVAATNRPNALDPALRRPGRLDREIAVAPPTAKQRERILRHHTRNMPIATGTDMAALAASCQGFTGADIAVLCREAAMCAVSASVSARAPAVADGDTVMPHGTAPVSSLPVQPAVSSPHWEAARAKVKPSLARGFAEEAVPLAWDDIGGLDVRCRTKSLLITPSLRACPTTPHVCCCRLPEKAAASSHSHVPTTSLPAA